MPRVALLALVLGVAGLPAAADVRFQDWREQRFGLFGGNDWAGQGTSVSVASDDSVSLLWTALAPQQAGVRAARWQWTVSTGVAPTPLDRRGGDDRNLAVYFVFMPAAIAERLRGAALSRLLQVEEARVLIYAWGGTHPRGAVLPSPYLEGQGVTIPLRAAGTGRHTERVDLAADYRRAFGAEPPALVGLAISADSDDTDGRIRARIDGFALE